MSWAVFEFCRLLLIRRVCMRVRALRTPLAPFPGTQPRASGTAGGSAKARSFGEGGTDDEEEQEYTGPSSSGAAAVVDDEDSDPDEDRAGGPERPEGLDSDDDVSAIDPANIITGRRRSLYRPEGAPGVEASATSEGSGEHSRTPRVKQSRKRRRDEFRPAHGGDGEGEEEDEEEDEDFDEDQDDEDEEEDDDDDEEEDSGSGSEDGDAKMGGHGEDEESEDDRPLVPPGKGEWNVVAAVGMTMIVRTILIRIGGDCHPSLALDVNSCRPIVLFFQRKRRNVC